MFRILYRLNRGSQTYIKIVDAEAYQRMADSGRYEVLEVID